MQIPSWLVLAKDWVLTLSPIWAVLIALFLPQMKRLYKEHISDPDNKNSSAIEQLSVELEKIKKATVVAQNINFSLLQHEIYKQARQSLNDGFITYEDYDHLSDLYKLYKANGGNSLAQKLYEQVQKLPNK